MARAELAKYNAMIFQDNKLQEKKITKGRLTAEQRALYEKKIKDIEAALDKFHRDVAGYNKTKAGYAAPSALSLSSVITMRLLILTPWRLLQPLIRAAAHVCAAGLPAAVESPLPGRGDRSVDPSSRLTAIKYT